MMATEIGISRNDDGVTVDFHSRHAATFGSAPAPVRTNVPFAEVGSEIARLKLLGHYFRVSPVIIRKLRDAGCDVSQIG
jgi:hypothetical protein